MVWLGWPARMGANSSMLKDQDGNQSGAGVDTWSADAGSALAGA
jgi:hypothetical protein